MIFGFDRFIYNFRFCAKLTFKMEKPTDNSEKNSAAFGNTNAEASLWVLLPKMFLNILISTVLILAIFWLYFGKLDFFALGFAIFIAALQILVIVGLRFQNRTEVHAEKPLQNDWLDKIGAWWLMACAFGALFGWAFGQAESYFSFEPLIFHFVIIFLTVILPIVTMLPNLRYIGKNSAHIQIPLLISITTLPILVGLSSAIVIWKTLIN